jgi:hypothetical protein
MIMKNSNLMCSILSAASSGFSTFLDFEIKGIGGFLGTARGESVRDF